MNQDDTCAEPREDVSRLVVLAIGLALLALAALSWPVIRALRTPVTVSAPDPVSDPDLPVRSVEPVPVPRQTVIMEAPAIMEKPGDDFILDHETLRQREAVSRDTVRRLREQAAQDPENGLSEESIQRIERDGDLIM